VTSNEPLVDDPIDESLDAEQHPAPPVVAVLVVRQPGPWFERCLASVAGQDYPNLSVLVLDVGEGEESVAVRVAPVLPGAFVRRIAGNPGFGPAANDVLGVVEGAQFFAFCHDDIALAPDAIRLLVEEAYRSNAGVVGPKLVAWEQPERLLQVGLAADKGGVPVPLVERGELDQEQHDAVRDVFAVPSACLVVRSDLFTALGGFDPGIDLFGEDVDLCWRAQVAGARVVVVPDARVEHRESMDDRDPVPAAHRLAARHRLRSVLVSYGRFHLLRVLPQLVVLTVLEALLALVTGHRAEAADLTGAWTWNAQRRAELRARRRALHDVRRFPDAEVRRLQVRGSARFRAVLRGELGSGDRLRTSVADLGRTFSDTFASPAGRLGAATWVLLALVFLVGTRHLLTGDLPWVRSIVRFDEGPTSLLRAWVSGWRTSGLGAEAPAPTAFGLLGMLGLVVGGAMGLLQHVLVLGCLPAGYVGAWRLGRLNGSRTGRVVCLAVYAAVPLPYGALARGDWGALLLYAAAPWILSRLLLAGHDLGAQDQPARPLWRDALPLGLLLALVAAFLPFVVLLVPAVAVALWLGALLAGRWRSGRSVLVALGAGLVAFVLHLPWSLDAVLPGATFSALGGVVAFGRHQTSMADLLRFETGGVAVPALAWAVPVASALALLIGRGHRFRTAVSCWTVALASWGLIWISGSPRLDVALPSPAALLAPAAAALAFAAALGAAAFEHDLRGFRFGWRQVVSMVAAGAAALTLVPVVATVPNGRWRTPKADLATSLDFLNRPAVQRAGSFRVLWLGPASDLPVASVETTAGLAYGLTDDGPGSFTERWAAPAYDPTPLVADAIHLAATGQTDRLGRLLATFGVRYVVVVRRPAPARTGLRGAALPVGLVDTTTRQLDLRRVEVDPAIDVFENVAWLPARAAVNDVALDGTSSLGDAATLDLTDSAPVLAQRHGPARFTGTVQTDQVYAALPADAGWELRVDGRRQRESSAFGWAQAWTVDDRGAATLRYRTAPLRWALLSVQVALWAAAVVLLLRRRRRGGVQP
jgi:GT2 family glycosyltransferase